MTSRFHVSNAHQKPVRLYGKLGGGGGGGQGGREGGVLCAHNKQIILSESRIITKFRVKSFLT